MNETHLVVAELNEEKWEENVWRKNLFGVFWVLSQKERRFVYQKCKKPSSTAAPSIGSQWHVQKLLM